MKLLFSLFALFALAALSHAQTLKWTHTVATPAFAFETADLYSLRYDGLGNLGFAVRYSKATGVAGNAGAQFTWVSAKGAVVFSITHVENEKVFEPTILSVSATQFLTAFTREDGLWTLRKYTKRGAQVTHTDLVLSSGERPSGTGSGVFDLNPVTTTFFTVTDSAEGAPVAIKRFTVR